MGDLKRLVGYTNAELAKIANRLSSHVPCIQTRNEETQAWYVNTTLWPRTYLQPLRPPQAA